MQTCSRTGIFQLRNTVLKHLSGCNYRGTGWDAYTEYKGRAELEIRCQVRRHEKRDSDLLLPALNSLVGPFGAL